jgi:hypothetical protein
LPNGEEEQFQSGEVAPDVRTGVCGVWGNPDSLSLRQPHPNLDICSMVPCIIVSISVGQPKWRACAHVGGSPGVS